MLRRLFLPMLFAILAAPPLAADEVYLDPAQFVQRAFDGNPPAPGKLWITPDAARRIKAALGRDLGVLREKYWRRGDRSAWILEAIGRDRPITAGFVVEGGAIANVSILIYRESRGGEVRYPFFTDQFRGARLTDRETLDRDVDVITGATLSSHAIEGLARVALILDSEARKMAK